MKSIILCFAPVLLAACSLFGDPRPDEGLKSRFLEAIDPDDKMFGVGYGASEVEIDFAHLVKKGEIRRRSEPAAR